MDKLFGSTAALRNWAIASLVANCALIVTGAVVRLSGSGLGCPTWPHCDAGSFVPKGVDSYHPIIEFGNRTLTFVLIALAVCVLVTAYRTAAAPLVKKLAWYALAGLPLQGVVGGITVLTKLNPYVVALHLLLSIWLVVVCTRLVRQISGAATERLPQGLQRLVVLLFWVMMVAIWLGTVVTGAGPHAGDHGAKRNGLDIQSVARLHALFVWVAVGLTLILLVQAARRGHAVTRRNLLLLLAAELVQGAIGYAQYFLGVPIGIVIWHMVGIGFVTVAVSWVYYGAKDAALPVASRDEGLTPASR